MQRIQTDRLPTRVSHAAWAAVLALSLAAVGCAAPSEQAATKPLYEAPETVTGSMLKRSNAKAPTDPAEIEQARRDAMQQNAVGIDKGNAPR
ncbi:hypothetical protein WG899_04210 [Paucibacter sp. AS339]|uniref:hypothetical protein n=1 Tax=Paucibacter hankyongi TaxID=3133434 RepID=UPI0030B25771